MAHNESASPTRVPEKLKSPKVSASSAPKKTATKRSATTVSEGQWPASSSTPTSGRKKPFLEPGAGTPLSVVSLNVSNLDHSAGSSSSRHQRTLTMRITRGIQTIAPQTANRYCTARIPKRTASVPVQTDNVFVLSSPPPPPPPEKTLLTDATCQTVEPAVQEASVGTSQQQQVVPPSAPCVDGWCQTLSPKGQSITTPKRNSTTAESTASSFTTGLSNIIQMYDCDGVADDKQTEDNMKRSKRKGKQTARDQQQHLLQESFVNETSKTIATKLDKKMSNILERHLATCNRSMARDRMKFMQWMKSYHTRQRQLEAKAARSQTARRVIVVRKRAAPVVVPRPALAEQSTQCDLPIGLPPEQPPKAPAAVTVGTQWTRQRQTVTNAKRKRAQTLSTGTQFSSKISTDPLPATGKATTNATTTSTTRKGPMRQTKLHSYAEGGKDQHPQQQPPPPRRQQQQRKCSPKLAVKEVSSPPVSKNPPAKKKPPPPPAPPKRGVDSKHCKQIKEPSPEIHIEETPSEPSDTEVVEKKHFPYRTQKLYPSQCSKSTETTFLTPTKVRDILPEPSDAMGGQPLRHVYCETISPQPNQSQLLSPMERMYVGRPELPELPRTVERTNYGPFLVPLGATGGHDEAISQTPPNMIYVNRPERRMLVRSSVPTAGNNNNNTTVRGTGLVREKYPELRIISSQQLCSQIGLAVEKALKNKTIPPLERMYGKPFIEVFNGVDFAIEDNDTEEDRRRVADGGDRGAGFACSSANDDLGQQQANRTVAPPPPPPFRNDRRSPSLSPIVYRGDDSEDDFL